MDILLLSIGGACAILWPTYGIGTRRKKWLTNWRRYVGFVKSTSTFNEVHGEVEKMLNDNANRCLRDQLQRKQNWALCFDGGGSRYGIMTTNSAESNWWDKTGR